VLVYGYGNPSRGDDRLGILFADTIEEKNIPDITTDTNYQLNAEDALAVSEHDSVVFVDASENDITSFLLRPCLPEAEVTFSTHAMSPGSVVALCKELYEKDVPAFILEIKGYSWGLGDPLSERAEENLHEALLFMEPLLRDPSAEKLRKMCHTRYNEPA
jgi:hydrogenase maturation protease